MGHDTSQHIDYVKRKNPRARDKSLPDPKRTTFPKENASKARVARIEAKYGLTVEEVCKAITLERGLLTEVALRLGVSRSIIRNYIGERPLCAQTLKDAREAMGDVAERKLFDLIEAGDVRCIMYYLTTVHKARGYGVKRDDSMFENHAHVTAINIVSVPNGTYLSSEEIKQLSIENQLQTAASEPLAGDGLDAPAEWVDGPVPATEPAAELETEPDVEPVVESCLS